MKLGEVTVAHALAFPREPGEDRIGTFDREGVLVVVVADGAGGIAGGTRASELLMELVREAAAAQALDLLPHDGWVDMLAHFDHVLEADPDAGETAGVVLVVSGGHVAGASCGDSGAWVILPDGRIDDFTARQHRKLRLGSGGARPISFAGRLLVGTLLVATDGLFNYARPEKIAAVALGEDLQRAARELIQLVKLPGGGFQDDVGVVLVRGSQAT
jgi:serine/threonine protein phosphatase PrpC